MESCLHIAPEAVYIRNSGLTCYTAPQILNTARQCLCTDTRGYKEEASLYPLPIQIS